MRHSISPAYPDHVTLTDEGFKLFFILLAFAAVGFVLATAYFVWTISIGGLAFGLLPTLLGLPLFVALLGSARAICLFEGRVVHPQT